MALSFLCLVPSPRGCTTEDEDATTIAFCTFAVLDAKGRGQLLARFIRSFRSSKMKQLSTYSSTMHNHLDSYPPRGS